jgi:hypothetical protein
MAVSRSDELRHSPAARDTKSSSRVIDIIIRALNNISNINATALCKMLPLAEYSSPSYNGRICKSYPRLEYS